jgi:hypothetical protein
MTQIVCWPRDGEKISAWLARARSLLNLTVFEGERVLDQLHLILNQLDKLKEQAAQLAAQLRTGTH